MKKDRRISRAWCAIRTREQVAEDTFWIELSSGEIATQAEPGQFVMIGFGADAWGSPFLPRPNSVASVRGDTIGLLIRVYGAGSRRLTELRPDDSALILGPLGTRFQIGDAKKVLCVAGGVGLAPFLMLPDWLKRIGSPAEVHLIYGEQTGAAVFDPDKIRSLSGLDAEIWTEDGSVGSKGRVTGGIDFGAVDLVLSCGPTPMLKAVRALCLEADVSCQLAVEERMACGVGTCVGCAIETIDPDTGADRYSLVCVDGPVFSGKSLRW